MNLRAPLVTRTARQIVSRSSLGRVAPPRTPARPERDSLEARFIRFASAPGPATRHGKQSTMSWLKVLENYAKLKDPQKELPAGVWVTSDEHT